MEAGLRRLFGRRKSSTKDKGKKLVISDPLPDSFHQTSGYDTHAPGPAPTIGSLPWRPSQDLKSRRSSLHSRVPKEAGLQEFTHSAEAANVGRPRTAPGAKPQRISISRPASTNGKKSIDSERTRPSVDGEIPDNAWLLEVPPLPKNINELRGPKYYDILQWASRPENQNSHESRPPDSRMMANEYIANRNINLPHLPGDGRKFAWLAASGYEEQVASRNASLTSAQIPNLEQLRTERPESRQNRRQYVETLRSPSGESPITENENQTNAMLSRTRAAQTSMAAHHLRQESQNSRIPLSPIPQEKTPDKDKSRTFEGETPNTARPRSKIPGHEDPVAFGEEATDGAGHRLGSLLGERILEEGDGQDQKTLNDTRTPTRPVVARNRPSDSAIYSGLQKPSHRTLQSFDRNQSDNARKRYSWDVPQGLVTDSNAGSRRASLTLSAASSFRRMMEPSGRVLMDLSRDDPDEPADDTGAVEDTTGKGPEDALAQLEGKTNEAAQTDTSRLIIAPPVDTAVKEDLPLVTSLAETGTVQSVRQKPIPAESGGTNLASSDLPEQTHGPATMKSPTEATDRSKNMESESDDVAATEGKAATEDVETAGTTSVTGHLTGPGAVSAIDQDLVEQEPSAASKAIPAESTANASYGNRTEAPSGNTDNEAPPAREVDTAPPRPQDNKPSEPKGILKQPDRTSVLRAAVVPSDAYKRKSGTPPMPVGPALPPGNESSWRAKILANYDRKMRSPTNSRPTSMVSNVDMETLNKTFGGSDTKTAAETSTTGHEVPEQLSPQGQAPPSEASPQVKSSTSEGDISSVSGLDSTVSSGAVSDIETEKKSLQMPEADLSRAAQSRLSPIPEPSSSLTDDQATESDQPSAIEASQPTIPVSATTHMQVTVPLQDERVEPAEVRSVEVFAEPALESSQVEQLYTTPESLSSGDFVNPSRAFGVRTRDFATSPSKNHAAVGSLSSLAESQDEVDEPPAKPTNKAKQTNHVAFLTTPTQYSPPAQYSSHFDNSASRTVKPRLATKRPESVLGGPDPTHLQKLVDDVARMTSPVPRTRAKANSPVFDEEEYAKKQAAAHAAIMRLHQTMKENLDQSFAFQVRHTGSSSEVGDSVPHIRSYIDLSDEVGRPIAPASLFSKSRVPTSTYRDNRPGRAPLRTQSPSTNMQAPTSTPKSARDWPAPVNTPSENITRSNKDLPKINTVAELEAGTRTPVSAISRPGDPFSTMSPISPDNSSAPPSAHSAQSPERGRTTTSKRPPHARIASTASNASTASAFSIPQHKVPARSSSARDSPEAGFEVGETSWE